LCGFRRISKTLRTETRDGAGIGSISKPNELFDRGIIFSAAAIAQGSLGIQVLQSDPGELGLSFACTRALGKRLSVHGLGFVAGNRNAELSIGVDFAGNLTAPGR
jgi:hypothetical protein